MTRVPSRIDSVKTIQPGHPPGQGRGQGASPTGRTGMPAVFRSPKAEFSVSDSRRTSASSMRADVTAICPRLMPFELCRAEGRDQRRNEGIGQHVRTNKRFDSSSSSRAQLKSGAQSVRPLLSWARRRRGGPGRASVRRTTTGLTIRLRLMGTRVDAVPVVQHPAVPPTDDVA